MTNPETEPQSQPETPKPAPAARAPAQSSYSRPAYARPAYTTPARPRPPSPPKSPDDKTIYVGKKELMTYVLSVVTQFQQNEREVRLKARGKAIARAVDIAEVVRHRFVTDCKVKSINISTEEVTGEDGRPTKVSSMEIILAR